MPPSEVKDVAGLTGVTAKPLERVPVRARSMDVTLAAWRLEVSSDQGVGGIVLAEASPDQSHYRGEGLFLGWPQEQLALVYKTFLTGPDESAVETVQLG